LSALPAGLVQRQVRIRGLLVLSRSRSCSSAWLLQVAIDQVISVIKTVFKLRSRSERVKSRTLRINGRESLSLTLLVPNKFSSLPPYARHGILGNGYSNLVTVLSLGHSFRSPLCAVAHARHTWQQFCPGIGTVPANGALEEILKSQCLAHFLDKVTTGNTF
jgi:hypothetical protein